MKLSKLYDFGFLLLFLALVGAVSLANPRECEAGTAEFEIEDVGYGAVANSEVILSVDNATGKFRWHPDADRLIADLPPERNAMKAILTRLRKQACK